MARKTLICCVSLLLIHTGMLVWLSVTDSPTPDEVKQIPAGVSNWHGEYRLYRVTPPLVRYIANIPMFFYDKEIDWVDYPERSYNRQETKIGQAFIESNGMDAFRWYSYGRLLCVPFSLLGGLVCFHWCRKIYGDVAAIITLTLWCFSPMIIAHGHYITTDMAATSLGVLACYWFWRWLGHQDRSDAFLTGIWLGLAILAKSTCIIFFLFWPVCLAIYWTIHCTDLSRRKALKSIDHVGMMFVFALIVINLGYLFSGSFTPLGDYTFKSKALAADDAACFGNVGGNRFRDSIIGSVPVPLPNDFVQGIDWQKADFECQGKTSYLLGKHRSHGWWWYYIVGIMVKEPLGIWLLWFLAVFVRFYYPPEKTAFVTDVETAIPNENKPIRSDRKGNALQNHEWFLWAMALMIFLFISSQTGLSRHTRYVMPAIPLLYILAGSVGAWLRPDRKFLVACTGIAVTWLIGASISIFPYSIAYFNELADGPRHGNRYLTGSNIDWGQDMLRLQKWIANHPEVEEIRYKGNHIRFDSTIVGTAEGSVPNVPGSISNMSPEEIALIGPQPGWFAVSVNYLIPQSRSYGYLLGLEPVAEIGYSTRIFHLTPEDANRLRLQHGLPELPAPMSEESLEVSPPNPLKNLSREENEVHDDNN